MTIHVTISKTSRVHDVASLVAAGSHRSDRDWYVTRCGKWRRIYDTEEVYVTVNGQRCKNCERLERESEQPRLFLDWKPNS